MANEIVGIDIGATSIKLVSLTQQQASYQVTGVGIVANPIGKIATANEDENVKLATTIKSLVKNSGMTSKKIHVGLAESQVFTRVIQTPVLSEAELASAIQWMAEQHVPVPLPEIQLDYAVLSRPEKGVREGNMEVLLIAVRKVVTGQLVDLFARTELEIVSIEPGLLGVIRALCTPKDPPTLVMHLGASSSDFAVVAGGNIALTYSVQTAGASLTRALETELNLSTAQAEQYKRAYGLNAQALEGKIRAALVPVFQSIIAEARKVINSFESTRRTQKIQRILLSGGTSLLPNMTSEIATALGVSEVIVSNPFEQMSVKNGVAIPTEHSVYSVAVGLAKGKE